MTLAVPHFKQIVHFFGHFAQAILCSFDTGSKGVKVADPDSSMSNRLLEGVQESRVLNEALF